MNTFTIELIDGGYAINPNDSTYPAQYILAGNPTGKELENHTGEFATFATEQQAQNWIDEQE